MDSNPKELIGLDVGRAHVGVARASTVARIAEPLTSWSTTETVTELKKMIERTPTEAVVVGLPRGIDGQETDQTRWTKEWLDEVKKQIEIPFFWQDEALTSELSKDAPNDHATAAARILQDFLDQKSEAG